VVSPDSARLNAQYTAFFPKRLASCLLFSYKYGMNRKGQSRMISLSMCFLALAVFAAALPSPVCASRLAQDAHSLPCGETPLFGSTTPRPCPDCATDSHCPDCMSDETHSRQVPLQGSPDEIRPLRSLSALLPLSAVLLPSHMNLSRDPVDQPCPGASILQQWCTVRLLV